MSNNRTYIRSANKVSKARLTKNKTLNTIIVIVLLVVIAAGWFFVEYPSEDASEEPLETTASAPTGESTQNYSQWSTPEAFGEALEKVDGLDVLEAKTEVIDYNRTEHFGRPWAYNYNGSNCDTRTDLLLESMEGIEMAGECKVAAGVLRYDPYTGSSEVLLSGKEISNLVHGEHIVALKDAWVSGSQMWDSEGVPDTANENVSNDPQERREQLANDPVNLIMVDASENQSKGDKDASEWIVPANQDFQCEYITRQVEVKYKYGLGVSAAELDSMESTLDSCVS